MRALVVAGSPSGSRAVVAELAASVDVVVAADSGAALCVAAGVRPDAVVGDLDSVDERVVGGLADAGVLVERHPADKDVTDLDLAIAAARSMGMTALLVTGALGGRLDHSLAALGTVARAADVWPCVVESDRTVWVLDSTCRNRLALQGVGASVSVLALSDEAVVSIAGVKWPLHRHALGRLVSHGVSNVIAQGGEDAVVSVESGVALVITEALNGVGVARECLDSGRIADHTL